MGVADLFGRHVIRRADDHAGAGDAAVGIIEVESLKPGQTQVEEFDRLPILGDLDVFGFDVPVNQAGGGDVLQGLRQLQR